MKLFDQADGVKGHFCIGRYKKIEGGFWEFYNNGEWLSAGEVFIGRENANKTLKKIQKIGLTRAKIKSGWDKAGKEGDVLGDNIFVKQWWTPIKWDDEEDPDFIKTLALDFKKK